MKQRKQLLELSYYGLYLLSYLKENYPGRLSDTGFLETRSALAADTYEQARREGHTVEGAQELAMATLLQGLHFSPFNILREVLQNEFPEEASPENAAVLAIRLQPSLEAVSANYSLSDDFASTPKYQALYTELTGAVLLYLEEHGL